MYCVQMCLRATHLVNNKDSAGVGRGGGGEALKHKCHNKKKCIMKNLQVKFKMFLDLKSSNQYKPANDI